MTAFLLRAGSGVPGDIVYQADKVIETAFFESGFVPASYGVPVKMVAGKLQAIQAADTAADFFGILSRLAPSIAGDTGESFGAGTPNEDAPQGVLVKGYITVLCTLGTPVRNDPVYMRIADNGPNLVGDLEATSVPAENVELVGVTWAVDGVDASNATALRSA